MSFFSLIFTLKCQLIGWMLINSNPLLDIKLIFMCFILLFYYAAANQFQFLSMEVVTDPS